MCRSAREGGQRCASATRPGWERTGAAFSAARGGPGEAAAQDEWGRAASEHASTADGRAEVDHALRNARMMGDAEAEVVLERALDRGKDLMRTAERVRAELGAQRPGPTSGTTRFGECSWMPEDSVHAARGLLRVYKIDPDEAEFSPADLPVHALDPSSLDDHAAGPDLDGYMRVEQMTADYLNGDELPPLLVIRHPEGWPMRYTVADGLHRLAAANDAGKDTINCLVVDQAPTDWRTFS